MRNRLWFNLLCFLAFVFYPLGSEEPRLTISSPRNDAIWTGVQKIAFQIEGIEPEAIQTVEVFLDGKFIKEFKSPPYTLTHDFGQSPKNSVLKIVVRGSDRVIVGQTIRSYQIDDSQEVEVSQVLVPVVVTDDKGNYISDLKKEDFVLQEDKAPQVILNFSTSGKREFHLVLLMDISSSMKDKIGEVKAAANTFLKQLLTKDDLASVIFFNHEVFEDADFSNNFSELANSIAVAFPFGATALYDAVNHCLKILKAITGQNIIILLSDGEDNSSYIDPYTLIKKAERSNVSIYTIGRKTVSYDNQYQDILNKLANSSGGITFFTDEVDEIRKVYEQIRRDIRAKYILEYAPKKNSGRKRFREITVKIKNRKRLNVRTIRGYYY